MPKILQIVGAIWDAGSDGCAVYCVAPLSVGYRYSHTCMYMSQTLSFPCFAPALPKFTTTLAPQSSKVGMKQLMLPWRTGNSIVKLVVVVGLESRTQPCPCSSVCLSSSTHSSFPHLSPRFLVGGSSPAGRAGLRCLCSHHFYQVHQLPLCGVSSALTYHVSLLTANC